MVRLFVALALLGLAAASPCLDGMHGCDKDEGGICLPIRNGGYTCSCREGYTCVKGCTDKFTGHTCKATTAAPSAPPTPKPTDWSERPINCGGKWSAFGECSFKCGSEGTWSQTYSIHRPARNGGMGCMFAEGEVRTKPCNRHACGCGKVYCQWKRNNFGYSQETHRTSIQVFHHDLEEWGKQHHCALSSKSVSANKDSHMVEKGQENCRCMCHNSDVDSDGRLEQKGAFKEWQENKDGKYKLSSEENKRLPEPVIHSMHFFPGVKPIYEPPAKDWKECQEACRNLKACQSWSMYTEEHKVYGNTCRVYDRPVGDAKKCDFTIPNFWTNGNFPCVVSNEEYKFRGSTGAGNIGAKSTYGSIDHLADVSDKTCSQLGWDTTNWGTEYHNTQTVCGARPDCEMKFKTYEKASAFCKAKGARLCTLAETQANEAAGTGCNMDKMAVWTSTPCKDTGSHYYVTLGNERWRRTATKEVENSVHCAHQGSQTVSNDKKNGDGTWDISGFISLGVQCCADELPCNGQCVNNGEVARDGYAKGTSGYVTGHITQLKGMSGVHLDGEDHSETSFEAIQKKY